MGTILVEQNIFGWQWMVTKKISAKEILNNSEKSYRPQRTHTYKFIIKIQTYLIANFFEGHFANRSFNK